MRAVESESAATLRWFEQLLGIGVEGAAVEGIWADVRDRMRRPSEQVVQFSTDWVSDPWVARGVQNTFLADVAPTWDPPDELDAWPTFGIGAALEEAGIGARSTADAALSARLAAAGGAPPLTTDAGGAVDEFLDSEAAIAQHGDAHMVRGEHVRAWLLAACGPLLRGLLLTPPGHEDLVTQAAVSRLALPIGVELPTTWVMANDFGERHLELLLNLAMQPNGTIAPLDPVDVRVGQGPSWAESWRWLSQRTTGDDARQAVRLAARLLRNDAVLAGVAEALAQGEHLGLLATGVVRRWALTLKAMAWVEEALQATWEQVRPEDVVCLGFSAVKPEWPRRIVAISHRSAEAKPALRDSALWGSSRFAIDATYLPAWETNTAMIWGLFAATPALVRVDTPTYRASLWCRREAEIVDYLAGSSDFLSGRRVVDVDISGLPALEALVHRWRGPEATPRGVGELPEFPPILTVWTPAPLPTHENAVLRAAGALRAMSAFLREPDLVNRLVVDGLLAHGDLPGPAPTNHPDGWRSYARIFREVRDLAPDGHLPCPLLLPPGYGPHDVAADDAVMRRVPDLASGAPALDDVLVGVEFLRTRWPILVDQGYGRFMALNLRGLTVEVWAADPELSLQRGLLALRTPVPLWLLQFGGQDVSQWGLPGDPPILTEHLERQWGWMLESAPEVDEDRARYATDSGLWLSSALRELLGAPP